MKARTIAGTATAAAIAIAIATGCSGETGLAGDTASDGDASIDAPADMGADMPDLPDGVDASDVPADVPADVPTDASCTGSTPWRLEARVIDSVELVDGTARVGSTQRLMVRVTLLSGCERLAGVEVSAMPGDATDFVSLLASAWVPVGIDCPPVAPIVETVVSVPGRGQDNLRVVVTDEASPGGGPRLEYGRETCTDPAGCYCAWGAPPGTGGIWSWCESDCSCQSPYSCVGYWGVAGPLWNCVDTCSMSDPRDCYARGTCLPPIPDGVPYVCGHDGDVCGDDEPCEPGFHCVLADLEWMCADSRTPAMGIACECDAQCPAGHMCVLEEAIGAGVCRIPCTSTESCPVGGFDALVCTNRWVCEFAD